jgi:hypothetical protein
VADDAVGIVVRLTDPVKKRLGQLNMQEAGEVGAVQQRYAQLRGEAIGGFLGGRGIDLEDCEMTRLTDDGTAVVYRPKGFGQPKPVTAKSKSAPAPKKHAKSPNGKAPVEAPA